MKNKNKGNKLEEALKELQKSIYKESKALNSQDATFIIKRGEKISGHEFDLTVRINLGIEGEEILYVYECKNLERAVGPKDVSYLKTKMEKIGASKGFIVAKDLTEIAEEDIKNTNGKIKHLKVEDYLQELILNQEPFYIELEDDSKRIIEPPLYLEKGESRENVVIKDYPDEIKVVEIRLSDKVSYPMSGKSDVIFSEIQNKSTKLAIELEMQKPQNRKRLEEDSIITVNFHRELPMPVLVLDNGEIFDRLIIKGSTVIERVKLLPKIGFRIESKGSYTTFEAEMPSGKYLVATQITHN